MTKFLNVKLSIAVLCSASMACATIIDRNDLTIFLDCTVEMARDVGRASYLPVNEALRELGASEVICVDRTKPVIGGADIVEFIEVAQDDSESPTYSSQQHVCTRSYKVSLSEGGTNKMRMLTKGQRGQRIIVAENGVAIAAPVLASEIDAGVFEFDRSVGRNCDSE